MSNIPDSHFKNYGEPEKTQSASDAATDAQIKSLTLSIATAIGKGPSGSIIDIGCGQGILLEKVMEVGAFSNNQGWFYIGIDSDENLKSVWEIAQRHRIRKRFETFSLKEF